MRPLNRLSRLLPPALAAALALAGCGNSVTLYRGGPPPPAGTVIYSILINGVTTINPGTEAGYGITAGPNGSYRLVWTGDGGVTGTYSHFVGSVWTNGTFPAPTAGSNFPSNPTKGCIGGPCIFGADDHVSAPQPIAGAQRIDFDSIASVALHGFDFFVDTEPVFFDLLIDGVRYPNLVSFPAADAQPPNPPGTPSPVAQIPFGLTAR